jgi:hypothetical protein
LLLGVGVEGEFSVVCDGLTLVGGVFAPVCGPLTFVGASVAEVCGLFASQQTAFTLVELSIPLFGVGIFLRHATMVYGWERGAHRRPTMPSAASWCPGLKPRHLMIKWASQHVEQTAIARPNLAPQANLAARFGPATRGGGDTWQPMIKTSPPGNDPSRTPDPDAPGADQAGASHPATAEELIAVA